MTTTTYRERLSVPLRWWVQGTMLVATFWLAMIVAVPAALAWGVTALGIAVMAALFLSYGSVLIEVDEHRLRVGRAHIDRLYLGTAEALDTDATRLAFGRDADVRAYLLLRPYRKRAVRVSVLDPADPAPYWLISTRHPRELAAVLNHDQ